MKFPIYIILFLLSICGINFNEQHCKLSGTYKVVYENDAKNHLLTKIDFQDSIYFRNFELGKVKGTIKKLKDRNGKCVFYLEDKIEQKVDPIKVSQVEKSNDIVATLKTMGKPIWEISEPLSDTIDFKIVYSGQLNVVIEKGKLIKQ